VIQPVHVLSAKKSWIRIELHVKESILRPFENGFPAAKIFFASNRIMLEYRFDQSMRLVSGNAKNHSFAACEPFLPVMQGLIL
jgi:hypothetical protein